MPCHTIYIGSDSFKSLVHGNSSEMIYITNDKERVDLVRLDKLLETPNKVRHILPKWFNKPTMKNEDLNFLNKLQLKDSTPACALIADATYRGSSRHQLR